MELPSIGEKDSNIGQVDGPNDDNGESGFTIPNWAYGAAAGGIAALATTAVGLYHWISRRKRAAEACEIVMDMEREQPALGTPREMAVTPRETETVDPLLI